MSQNSKQNSQLEGLEMQRIASNGPLLCQVNSQWRMEVGNAISKKEAYKNADKSRTE